MSRWLFAALIVAASLLAIRSLAPQTIGETARCKFLSQLREHYPNHDVSVRHGHFDPNVGLVFEDLRISEPASSMLQFRSREMVRIERLTVIGDLHAEKLLDQQNPLVTRRVLVEGLTANLWLEDDDQLSILSLLPLPKLGPAAPRIDLRQVRLRLLGDSPSSRPIDAEMSEVVILNHVHPDQSVDTDITVVGATDFANDVKLKVSMRGGSLDVRCAANGVHFNRRLYDNLPSGWRQMVHHAKDLNCVCDSSISYHRTAAGKTNYQIRTAIHDGRFAHTRLPEPISQIRGLIVCDPSGLTIEASQANLGDAIMQITGKFADLKWPCQADLEIRTRGLLLDDRLSSALPASLQEGWRKLQPFGRIDIDAKLAHRDGQWQTDADLTCKGVDVRYEKFPYPIEQVVGPIRLRNNILTTEGLSGRIASQLMQCAFRLPTKPEITHEKSLVVTTDGPIPIDNSLLKSLSPRGADTTGLESFVRSLRPRGSIQLGMAVFATDARGHQTKKIELKVIDGHMRYDKFAYPLYNVSGGIVVDNDLVTLSGFRATNANAGVITCDGTYRMPTTHTPPAQFRITDDQVVAPSVSRLDMNFQASNVPMDESLRSSLPWTTQQTWDAISPSGVLDELNLRLGKTGVDGPIQLDITARQRDHGQVTNRILSIRPSSLPYRLDVTGGVVHFDGSSVKIESLYASHDASKLSAEGVCVQDDDGRWVLTAQLHSGSRLHPDAELIAALPSQMREAMRRLQLRGPVSIRGSTRLTIPDEARPEPIIDWDLDLQLEGNRIADVGPVHSLRGEISIKGTRNESILQADGQVKIDSMHIDDLQVTGIRGPFSINDDRLLLGGRSTQRRIPASFRTSNVAPSISGRLFDGSIDMDGEVILSSGDFDVGVAVQNARVPTLLADFGYGDADLTGTFTGQTKLQGNLGSSDLLKGNGAARVTGANLYQLPMIVKVMNLINLKPTEDVAFTDGEVEFTIFGDAVTFNDLQIWGDLVSLQGGGTMNRRQELDLTFNTRVSPQNTFTKIIRPLRSQRYTLMTIDVTGPLSNVQIERRALDGVGETLGRIFPGMGGQEPETSADSGGGFGGWFR
ncbi:AsmA-like C-terminal region-containing protein [Rubripirellula lacrimiformis]|nr:AsmA-like C-terminal region-containing protein [Rubripirellula lacrimiformis]